MRRPLGVLAAVATLSTLAACGTSAGGARSGAAGAASEVTAPADAATAAPSGQPEKQPQERRKEPDECRVSVARPDVAALTIRATAARRDCVHPALLRIRVKRAVPGDDPVVKSGATKDGRITLRMPCKPGTYYTVATDYRGGTATSKAVRLTCATPAPTPTPTPAPTKAPTRAATKAPATSSTGTAVENEVVRLTNAERAKGGCGPLTHDARLRQAAFGHSADMAKNDYFEHDSQDGRDMVDRIKATGFTGSAWAENIAMGQRTAAEVVEGWMNSDGHRRNIMNCSYTHIGVGAARNGQGQLYWTQDFARR
ncbi:Cysteine-rich secretory protein family protein [Nonomuraea coxensis DSM 45129]|uniref:Cysteine-rich secretory protein family protein n=1 Tax=Nonomuraea coxensis DSM 45129 TaxID=1122611 RepID=A0ABX8U1V6_9ACTN|nr:CAP domain-containing protein [Nonomuraea coxensis]QYC41644.1 Cysteine-rich secretory protein family protein [Nonomuraea coxensis DSM 45129]